MKTLNIIGAGRVGRTLAALWQAQRTFQIQDVCSRTPDSARAAVSFIGSGRAVDAIAAMQPADLWMLTPPDDAIAACCEALAASKLLRSGDLVFHCSGALPSSALQAVTTYGAHIASVHPLKSVADPQEAVRSFAGTFCAAEGARAALNVLVPAFEHIGARISEIDAQFKTIYHAASVLVSNYLVALMEAGLRCYEKAGIARDTAATMMEPLVRETVDNVFHLGTVQALTGPIARGDYAVVARQLQALAAWNPQLANIYRELGVVAANLSTLQGKAGAVALAEVVRVLDAQPQPGAPR